MTSGRELVVNADDFGMSPAINAGIVRAHEAGTVTSTSLMATMSAFDDALRSLRMHPTLGVGVHLTLTVGAPLTPAASLVDRASGTFLPLPLLIARALAGRIRGDDVAAECRAQIRRIRDRGVEITHLDGHHHVHLLPGVWRAVRAVAREEGIGVIRHRAEPLRGIPEAGRRIAQRIFLRALCANAAAVEAMSGTATHFRGEALLGSPRFAASLARTIDSLPTGRTELMVHPGYTDRSLPGKDRYTWQREVELDALVSPRIVECLRESDVALRRHR